jgi:RecA-family ATPase
VGLLFGCGEKKEPEKTTTTAPGAVAPGQVKKEAAEAADKAAALVKQQKEAYQKGMQATLDDYKKKIADLDAKAATLKEESKAQFAKEMEKLKAQEQELTKKWIAFKSDTGTAWENMKAGLDNSMNELKKSYDQAASYFK